MILVTEYMVGGDLWNVLGHDTEHNFSWYKRCSSLQNGHCI